jgi:zinc protease
VLDVIQAVMSIGEGARLSRQLVRSKEVATSVAAYFEWRTDPGLFKVSMELPPDGSPAKAIAALDVEFAKLQKKPLTAAELQRAKNILRGQTLRSLATHNGKAHAFGEHELLFGSWKDVFQTLDRYEAVTVEQVQAAAQKYLVPEHRSIVELVPANDEAGAEAP